jgi:hypothetical protein
VSNLDQILSFLTGKGLTGAQAAGVAGNLQVESGFSPTAYNPREGAIGIAQWEGGRRTALDSYAKKTGGSETDLNTQLGYLWSELQGSESNALHRLLATNDAGSAAAAFDQFYERSAGTSRGARMSNAQQIAAGHPSTTGPAGGGAAPGLTAQNVGLGSLIAGNWQADVLNIALKFGGGCAAAALVVIGVRETVKG